MSGFEKREQMRHLARVASRDLRILGFALAMLLAVGCSSTEQVDAVAVVVNPETGIEFVSVDRFSDDAGTVMRRSQNSELPAPNEPIDYDADFLNHALAPDGSDVSYYAFDVNSLLSAPVYSFVYASDPSTRVDGQAPIFDVIPGDEGYNDYWQVVQVLVPDDYVPDSIRSFKGIEESGYEQKRTATIINCPLVPAGSTAEYAERNSTGWYRDKHVQYFSFETFTTSTLNPETLDVPYAIVRVIFEDNDPSKGMKMDPVTGKTHNVFDSIPGDELYRSLWRHDFVDEADFDLVSDWASSEAASEIELEMDHILVNCPVVIWEES